MQTTKIPNSFRTEASELAYQHAKERGWTVPLQDEPAILAWRHWKLIKNRFPYDMIFSTHEMLIPRRIFANREEMNLNEQTELNDIIRELENQYDLLFENLGAKRSNNVLYHLHLARQKPREAVCASGLAEGEVS